MDWVWELKIEIESPSQQPCIVDFADNGKTVHSGSALRNANYRIFLVIIFIISIY